MTDGAKSFYHIERHEDGTATVSFFDAVAGSEDITEYSMPVVWFDGLEGNIREHFRAWVAHTKAYCEQKAAFERALALLRGKGGNDECSR